MESDTEILDRLFSMFDKTGNDQINYKEFVGGLAPLCHGSVEEKLACELPCVFGAALFVCLQVNLMLCLHVYGYCTCSCLRLRRVAFCVLLLCVLVPQVGRM